MIYREKDNTCFFTGHRIIPQNLRGLLIAELDKTIRELLNKGFLNFVCGGAIGFDTAAACRAIVASRSNPDLRLILVLPCRDQTMKWKSTHDISLYHEIKGHADEIIYTADLYRDGCMFERNRMMADMSSLCVAYHDGGQTGGTAYTVKYAEKNGMDIINLYNRLH